MSDLPDSPKEYSPDSTIDTEMARILEQYLEEKENGTAMDREEWLARHPEHADRLAACLDGVDLMGAGGVLFDQVRSDLSQPLETSPRVIGDYEIIGELGRGGMGVVYEAREKSLDRIVALKVMRFGVVDPKALERFQREAETAGDLHHTNIVPVYATGREGDTSWYAMQRIEGESLAKRVCDANQAGETIALDDILDIGIQSAEALDHAHQRSVIHRDVKPANLIVDGDDRVWLTDFGLARRLVDVGATMTGAMMGTPRYMSPEQASLKGGEVDHRTDIYSLGATLFEVATGKPPFDGDDPLSIISQIRYKDAVGVRQSRSDLPRDLEVVLAKCMEKDARRRYASAADLATDLRAIREDRAISARPISLLERATRTMRKHGARFRVAGLAVFATAATILLSLAAWQGWQQSQLGAFRFRAGGGPFVSTLRPLGEDSFSPNARTLTVPMQVPMKLKAGDYDMLLAPRGEWSQRVRIPIAAANQAEYRMGGRSKVQSVDIEGANAVAVAGFDKPAVLLRRDGILQRVASSGQQWTLDVSDVETPVTRLNEQDDEAKSASVNFANTNRMIESSLSRVSFELSSQFAAPCTALTTPIDLDGDNKADTIVAALDKSALLAINADGNVLWSHAYDLNGDFATNNAGFMTDGGSSNGVARKVSSRDEPQVFFPGVMQMIDVGDADQDGISDLALLLINIQRETETDTAIVVVSGQSGDEIVTIKPGLLKVAEGVAWPIDGMLSLSGKIWRDSGTLRFGQNGAVRNRINWDVPQIRWSRGRVSQSTMAVPSPMQVVTTDSQTRLAVYYAGDECRVYDLITGQQVGKTIKSPFSEPAPAPRVARLGGDDYALVFHEPEISAKTNRSGDASTSVVAFRLNDGKQLWRHELQGVDWSETNTHRSRVDWPLIGDADSDGDDELLLPIVRRWFGLRLGVRMLDAATGKSIWSSEDHFQIATAADESVHRMALSSDIDGDGWREWVTASVAGDPEPSAIRRKLSVGKAYVYLEWISGKTGHVISWARSPIPVLSDRIDVAEINAIRTDVPGGDTGSVEVDLITGDTRRDLELDSSVLCFHPSKPDPVAIAAGVEAVALPVVAGTDQRLFYARPGPYSEGPERLVFLKDQPNDSIRLGENQPVAAWRESGRGYVALKSESPKSLVVIDSDSHQTLWRWQRDEFPNAQFYPVTCADGSVDIILHEDAPIESPVVLLDGKTGRSGWTTSEPVYGRIKAAYMLDEGQRVLIVGDGNVRSDGFPRAPDYFKMTMANAATGQVQWSKYFLRRAPRYNHPQVFDYMRFVDVNGDGVSDIIGPDQGKVERLLVSVWDGASGEVMWSRPLSLPGSSTNYYLSFSVLKRRGRYLVAYVGPKSERERDERLLVCDASTGAERMSIDLETRYHIGSLKRFSVHTRFAMADCSVSPEHPRLGVMLDDGGETRFAMFDISGDSAVVESLSRFEVEEMRNSNVWLRDVDGDSIPERIIASYKPIKSNRKEYVLTCYPLDSQTPMWEMLLRKSPAIHDLHWLGDSSLGMVETESKYSLVDFASGLLLQSTAIPEANRLPLPLLMGAHGSNEQDAWRLAQPKREGIAIRWVGQIGPAPLEGVPHEQKDPRRVKKLFGTINSPANPWVLFTEMLKGIGTLVGLVLVPVWYFGRMIRSRRWSLSWMLLAPPVVVLFMMVWNAPWSQLPGRAENLFQGVNAMIILGVVWWVFGVKSRVSDRPDYRFKFVTAIAICFLVLLGLNYLSANDPTYHYVVDGGDVVKLLWISVGLIIQFSVLLIAARYVLTWLAKGLVQSTEVPQGGGEV